MSGKEKHLTCILDIKELRDWFPHQGRYMIHVYSRKGMIAMKCFNSAAASLLWFLERHLAWENTWLRSNADLK